MSASVPNGMKAVSIGSGKWTHASKDGKITLCGRTNIQPTACDEITCMQCLKRLF